jgi:Tol biopolymer transport system component
VFIGRDGKVEALKLAPGAYVAPRISPDGTRVAYGSDEDPSIWIYDLSGATAPQKLPGAGPRHAPIWVGDDRVAFQSEQENVGGIFWQRADGTGPVDRLTKAEGGTSQVPESWSSKSETLLYAVTKESRVSLHMLSVRDKRDAPFGHAESPRPLDAVFSPDGQWVAYDADKGGQDQVYVVPFPPTDEPREAPQRGQNPFWSPDGKQLFYGTGSGAPFGVVAFSAKPKPVFGNPSTVPRGPLGSSGPDARRNYDLDPASGRILGVVNIGRFSVPTEAAETNPALEVVLGWFEELKGKVPVK